MRNKEIVTELAQKHNLPKKVVSELISDYEEIVLESAKKEGRQRMKNMIVKVVERGPREGVAPNGKKWKIGPRKVFVVKVKKSRKIVK